MTTHNSSDWKSINCPSSLPCLGKKARMAILRMGVKKYPFKLQDVLPDAGGASLNTVRRQAKLLVEENCLVRLSNGAYIAASAYDPTAIFPSPKHGGGENPAYSTQEILTFLAYPRTMHDICRKLGRERKAVYKWIAPLIQKGKVHRMRIGMAYLYATSIETLKDAEREMKISRLKAQKAKSSSANLSEGTSSGRYPATRFGGVSRIGAEILRHRSVPTSVAR